MIHLRPMMHLRARVATEFWDLVSLFFTAWGNYKETHETYERMVIQYAHERGVDRRHLRLTDEEVAGLLEMAKLEVLRDDLLGPLKTISHKIFRGDGQTDPLDRLISQIFHEISILKEEQYKVATFAPEYKKREDQREYESILDEVHDAFPRHVHETFELFQRGQERLEILLALPRFSRDKITLRSVFLFGDETFKRVYPDGAEDVLEIMFPEGGAAQGFLAIARSFLEAGFREYAIEALERALKAAQPLAVRTDGASLEPYEAARREAEEMLRELKKDVTKRRHVTNGGRV